MPATSPVPTFITPSGQPLNRWRQAFPDLKVTSSIDACLADQHSLDTACCLDISGFSDEKARSMVREVVAAGATVVVLSAVPSESEAYAMLSLGARGYCHAEAVPEQLQEVIAAVTAGGFWMPPSLVQRLVVAALRVDPEPSSSQPEGFEQLTEREYEVAMAVGRGANNKEIADKLDVSERTVKAHLTSTFEKLGLRDRVQLALAVNRLPFH